MNKKNKFIQTYVLLILEIICIIISYYFAHRLRYKGGQRYYEVDLIVCLSLVVFALVLSLVLDWNKFIYKRGYIDEFLAICKYEICMSVALAFIVFVLRLEDFSRLVFGTYAVLNMILTYSVHIIYKKWLWDVYRKSVGSDKIVVITRSRYVKDIVAGVHEEGEWSSQIIGLILVDDTEADTLEGIPVVGNKDNIESVLSQLTMDIAFLYVPGMEEDEKNRIIDIIETMGVTCYYGLGHKMQVQNVGIYAGYTVVAYEQRYIDYKRQLIKRLFDIFGAIVGLIITGVLFPFIALAIKIDSPGPVIFSQTRIGRNGRRFNMYKFRSMYIDAEERKKELMAQNEVSGLMFKMEDDPRITKVGKFIRKTSIDELPQFVNVLLGDMSLIGTRPPTVDEFEQYSPHYRRRLSITPGLTGLWQVSGRSDITDFDEVVNLDLEYIDNWSLTLDFKILVKTVGVVLRGSGSK